MDLPYQIIFVTSRRLRESERSQLRADVVSHWKQSTLRRERHQFGKKIGRSTRAEIIIRLIFTLPKRINLQRTLVGRLGRRCEFKAAVENILMHLGHARRAWRGGRGLPTTQPRRRSVQ